MLGLDKLAAQKRAEALARGEVKSEPPSKRVKLELEDEGSSSHSGGVFKGELEGKN